MENLELLVGNLEFEIGSWNLKLEVKIQIGIIYFELEFEIGNWQVELDMHNACYWRRLEIESWNRKSKFEIKLEIWNGN